VLSDLLTGYLPDGRQFAFIPSRKHFPPLTDAEWQEIKRAARAAKKLLLRHAYYVIVEMFDRWRLVGVEVLTKYHERERQIAAGEASEHPGLLIERPDFWLQNWIFRYARDLWIDADASPDERKKWTSRVRSIVSSKRALATIALQTGYTEQSVEGAIYHTGTGRSHATKADGDAPTKRAAKKAPRRGHIKQSAPKGQKSK
jgi:hypothetical protein